MNILMISSLDIWSLGKKSGAPSLYETIKGYLNNNHKIYYLTDRSGKKIKKEELKLNNFSIEAFNLNINIESLKIQAVRSILNKVRWLLFQLYVLIYGSILIRKNKIDIIYGYEIFGIPAAFLLKIIFDLPLITRFQGTILKPKLYNPLNLILYFEHTLAFILSRFSDLIIMANDGTEGDSVLKYFNAPFRKVRFWFNGVDIKAGDIMQKKSITVKNKKISFKGKNILITLSRLAAWKKVDRIIKVMPFLVKKNNNLILIIIGDGEERAGLESMVKDLKISGRVYFTGALPHHEAAEILKASNIFVSLYDLSNVGNPLLEAMKMGKCIVTLNNGDTGKIIINNKTGILLEYGDLQDKLARQIINLLNNKKLIKKLGVNARSFADEHFVNWEQRMKKEVLEVEKIQAFN